MAICLASGRKVFEEFAVDQGPVLLISKEDPPRLIQERLKAFGADGSMGIYFCTDPQLYFDTDSSVKEVQQLIEEYGIKTIIIDSFRRIFRGEENSSQVIGQVQQNLKLIAGEDVTIIFVHHHGKENIFKRDMADKLRGSSDILAMLDSLLILERKEKDLLKITQEVLRSDIPLSPFVVSMPDLNSGEAVFKMKGYIEEEKEKEDLAKEDAIALLRSEDDLSQSAIIDKLVSSGVHRPTTVKNALKELTDTKKIRYRSVGKEHRYHLIQENESTGQIAVQNDLLTHKSQRET